MLTKLYVDNYKSLVNFDVTLGRQHLLMGPNGSGKSTVFEVLEKLRNFLIRSESADECFGRTTLTRWQTRPLQSFGLEFTTTDGHTLKYDLTVKHAGAEAETLVGVESLALDGKSVFSVSNGQVVLLDNDRTWGPFPMDPRKSFMSIGFMAPPLVSLRELLAGIHLVRADPIRMDPKAVKEHGWLWPDLSNFASWYRGVATQTGAFYTAFLDLHGALPGFKELRLNPTEDGRRLVAMWKDRDGEVTYDFSELSDGQRALIGLYCVAHWLQEKGGVLCLDEPDNFLALREIQPLLSLLEGMEKVQTLVISHHPEVINGLAREHGLRFERHFRGPARVSKFKAPPDTLLTPAELVARGEEDGPG